MDTPTANHDQEYARRIDELIPAAYAEAVEITESMGVKFERRSGVAGTYYKHYFLVEHFHKAMNRLASENGLRPRF